MTQFRIVAQSYTSTARIEKVISAKTEGEALRVASLELENAGFYTVSVSTI